LWKKAPVFGIGLGNFRAMFSSARNFSAGPNEAIHPESDWLWAAVEIGGIGVALILAAALLWLKSCFPFTAGTWQRMRMGALIAGLAFAFHGLFDVSGHRIG